MNRTHQIVFSAAAALILVAASIGSAAVHLPASQEAGDITLKKVQEMRVANLVEDEPEFTFPGEEPGLTLTFRIDLPDGRRLLEVAEPTAIEAGDSTGRDLTDIEEDDFSGEKDFIEMGMLMSFNDDEEDQAPAEFTVMLGLPARAAESFSLDATLDVTTYSGTRDYTVEVGDAWVDLDPAMFGGKKVRARLGKSEGFFGDGSVGLQVMPADVAGSTIADMSAKIQGRPIESSWTMSDSEQITYGLDSPAEIEEGAVGTITFQIRTGVETKPMQVKLEKQPLP